MEPSDPQNRRNLTVAASALEAELCRFEDLARAVGQGRLSSEKGLARAATAIQEAAESESRLARLVQALLAAMTHAQERQLRAAQALAERGEEVRQRAEVLQGLLDRLAALGACGREINTRLQEIAACKRKGGVAAPDAVGEVLERMTRAADDARDLAQAARGSELPEIGQQADSLRQQILAARNKLNLLQRGP